MSGYNNKITIIGVPGAGKTRWIVNHVKDKIYNIALTSVTLAPIYENLKRLGLNTKINGVRTIYGLCYLAMKRERLLDPNLEKYLVPIVNTKIKTKLAKIYKLSYYDTVSLKGNNINKKIYTIDLIDTYFGRSINRVIAIYTKAIMRYGSFDAWEEYIPLLEAFNIPLKIFETIDTLRKRGKFYDYPFLIEDAYKNEINILKIKHRNKQVNLKEIYVDEAHDLGKVPYYLLDKSYETLPPEAEFVMVGDPAQAIYSFLGATPEILLKHSNKIKYLDKTWRFGKNICELANRLLKKMNLHYTIKPNEEVEDNIEVITPLDINKYLKKYNNKNKSIAFLCRSNYQADLMRHTLLRAGYYAVPIKTSKTYTFEKVIEILKKYQEYKETHNPVIKEWLRDSLYNLYTLKLKVNVKNLDIISKNIILNKIDKILKEDNNTFTKILLSIVGIDPLEFLAYIKTKKEYGIITVDTIHATKGLEFDIVFLLDEIPYQIRKELENPTLPSDEIYNAELRVFYVGVTRAKENLYIISTPHGYLNYYQLY